MGNAPQSRTFGIDSLTPRHEAGTPGQRDRRRTAHIDQRIDSPQFCQLLERTFVLVMRGCRFAGCRAATCGVGNLRHAPGERPASIRPSGGNPGGCPALLRALRVPWRLDAGHLRRGRHESGQPLPLLPVERGADRRHRRARPRRGRAAVRQRRPLARLLRGARRPGASPLRGAAGRAGDAVHRGHVRSPPQSGDRPHLGGLRCRREEVAGRSDARRAPSAATFRATSTSTASPPC